MQDNVLHVTDYDPFDVLGLTAGADLTDDEVRAAWRRIAAATHPDLPDGGDAAWFAAAAAAYATLRTSYGRGEAYADLAGSRAATAPADATAVSAPAAPGRGAAPGPRTGARRLVRRVRAGRPARLSGRVGLAVAVSLACAAVAGWQPATLAIAVGCLTWLVRTTRYDLAPAAAAGVPSKVEFVGYTEEKETNTSP
jgi:hypothetical protein